MSSVRTPGHVADTGYLLCFGAVPRGLKLLRSMFDPGLSAPTAVKAELQSLEKRSGKSQEIRKAASQYNGNQVVLEIKLIWADVPERDLALEHIAGNGTLPIDLASVQAQCDSLAERTDVVPATVGQDAGEAEAIAVCLRLKLPLLINDSGGRRYARLRNIPTESAAVSLKRLLGTHTPRELFGLYRQMERSVGDPGEVVTGHLWFRQPTPSPVRQP
jgi:hypothetical protein